MSLQAQVLQYTNKEDKVSNKQGINNKHHKHTKTNTQTKRVYRYTAEKGNLLRKGHILKL